MYSTSTSLLVRHLRIDTTDSVSAFAFSSTTQGHLYLSTIAGTIEKWDWAEGSRLGRWKTSSSIYSLMTAKQNIDDPSGDLVYTVDRKAQGSWLISVHRLVGHESGANTDSKTLFTNQQALSSINVLERGRVIVATSGSELILGSTNEPAPSPLEDLSYTWRVVQCPEHIASTDFRVRPSGKVQKPSKGGRSSLNAIDIVVGGLKGSIHIYDDLLRKIIRRDDRAGKGNSIDITSRRLHWHRNAVQAVKWSADGTCSSCFNFLTANMCRELCHLWRSRNYACSLAAGDSQTGTPSSSWCRHRKYSCLSFWSFLWHPISRQFCYGSFYH